MDPQQYGEEIKTQEISLFPRVSAERNAPRLQKKPPARKSSSAPLTRPAPLDVGSSRNAVRLSGEALSPTSTTRSRTGSIRNAVRRIFGRRSRLPESETVEEEPTQPTLSQYSYRVTQPLSATERQAAARFETEPWRAESWSSPPEHSRAVSDSAPVVPPLDIARTRSTHAIAFPRSARLKPLDLGNPFAAPNQLRRRKTLPSVLAADQLAGERSLDATAEAPPPQSGQSGFGLQLGSPSEAVLAARAFRRRSRSVEELTRADRQQSPLRNRSEELRYWRESFQQGSVLRASVVRHSAAGGSAAIEPRQEQVEQGVEGESAGRGEDSGKTPAAPFVETFEGTATARPGPSGEHSPLIYQSPGRLLDDSGPFDAVSSADLEDRVARLESGLRSFQRSLQRLTADRNRRTIIVGGETVTRRRSFHRTRTPSMLADTLVDNPLSGFIYDSAYLADTEMGRPATSPAPETPLMQEEMTAHRTGGGASDDVFREASTTTTTERPQQPASVQTLYRMLADERSARRRLESTVQTLRSALSSLQYQVSADTSQRGSFFSRDDHGGSQRLRDLLRDHDNDSSGHHVRTASSSTGALGLNAPVVSRFSGSDTPASEIGGLASVEVAAEEADAQTPYEAYQTPLEQYTEGFPPPPRSRQPWGEDIGLERHERGRPGGMF